MINQNIYPNVVFIIAKRKIQMTSITVYCYYDSRIYRAAYNSELNAKISYILKKSHLRSRKRKLSAPEFDDDGVFTGYIGTLTDITDRKLAQAQLESYRDELELQVEARTAELQKAIGEQEGAALAVELGAARDQQVEVRRRARELGVIMQFESR